MRHGHHVKPQTRQYLPSLLLQTLPQHNINALTCLPGDHGVLEHDQGHGHEEDAEQLTMFHTAETLCFGTILLHDGLGSPRRVPMANDFEQGTQTHCFLS